MPKSQMTGLLPGLHGTRGQVEQGLAAGRCLCPPAAVEAKRRHRFAGWAQGVIVSLKGQRDGRG